MPNIPNIAAPANQPLIAWLQKQAASGALMHSWCKGAMALAESGLLDGLEATAHWGDLPALERRYPRVHWVRGVRWVEHGAFVISAGITSGIDASLHLLRRLEGDELARRVARELRYPNFHFAIDPRAEQYALAPADAVLLLHAAFGAPLRERIGLVLYRGVGELDLSNVYDAHAYTMVGDVTSVSEEAEIVESAHGLTLLPSIMLSTPHGRARARQLERLLVPDPHGRGRGASLVNRLSAIAPTLRAEYLHAATPHRFGLEPVLEDLAETSDVATARFALRRMEYRSSSIELEGNRLPWRTLALSLLLGALGVSLLRAALWQRRRTSSATMRSSHERPTPKAQSDAAVDSDVCGSHPTW